MISRRVFLKNGAFALVSLGFAPSFLTRTAFAQATVGARRSSSSPSFSAARSTASASSSRSARASTTARGRASRSRGRTPATSAAIDLDGFFGFNPRLQPLKPLWDRAPARDRPRLRIARHHAVAFRRAGLHGNRHARREEHGDGWLNRYLQARRVEAATPFRAVALTGAAAAHAAGHVAGARDEPDRSVRHPRRPGQRRRRMRRSRRSMPRRPTAC